MTCDGEFLRHLQATEKIEYYLFGSSPFWKIKGTGLSLEEKQRFVSNDHCSYAESQWYVLTTRYFIVVKMSEFTVPLEEFWNGLDFVKLEAEGKQLDEWFSQTPDY